MSLAFKRYKPVETGGSGERMLLQDAFRSFANEIRVLREPWVRRCNSILDLLGICFEAKHADGVLWPVLVFEKAPFGNLRQFMNSEIGTKLSGRAKLSLCRDLLLAVATMHGCDIIHGDLKPDNILIFPHPEGGFVAKVIDFCFSHVGAVGIKLETVVLPCLVCLWLFLRDDLCLYWEDHARTYNNSYRDLLRNDEKGLCKLKIEDELGAFADRCLSKSPWTGALGSDDISRLRRFWFLTLARDKKERPLGLWGMLDPGGDAERPTDMDSWMSTVTRNHAVDGDGGRVGAFKISKSLPQLIQADYRLRRQLVETLDESVTRGNLDDAYELALCKAIGFGTRRDTARALELVISSPKPIFQLETDIDRLRHGRVVVEYQGRFAELSDEGYIQRYILDVAGKEDVTRVRDAYNDEIGDLEGALGSSSPAVIQLKQRLAGILLQNGDFTEAGALYSDVASAIAQKRDALPDFPSTWNPRGFEERKAWDYIATKAIKENTVRMLQSRGDMVDSHRLGGNWAAAERIGTEALPQLLQTVGEEHLQTLAVMESLAMTHMKRNKWKAAEQLEEKVLEVRREVLGPSHHLTLQSATVLASIYGCVQSCREFTPGVLGCAGDQNERKLRSEQRRQRRQKRGETLLESVMQSPDLMRDHPVCIDAEAVLASIYIDQRRWDFTESLELGVLEKRTETLGPDHPDTLASRGNVALILKARGETQGAEKHEKFVLETRKRVLGPRHPDTLVAMTNLAFTLKERGQEEEASALFEEVRNLKKELRKDLKREVESQQKRERRRKRLGHLASRLEPGATRPMEQSPVVNRASQEVDEFFRSLG
ncbi:hypothetical protein N656DRAFT_223429 [Canariomyces notabilis]|uniref:Protein kinase domain-containing protein n=1 Tax=Canariomyces notabilis TaxID=2074819 RepID=A0AAN6TKH8_9PEZI|nr:hypothetical protein N656DRAFT_223429 [Canariomyces arenarius]